MDFWLIVVIFVEVISVILLFAGYLNEDKVVNWEDRQIAKFVSWWLSKQGITVSKK